MAWAYATCGRKWLKQCNYQHSKYRPTCPRWPTTDETTRKRATDNLHFTSCTKQRPGMKVPVNVYLIALRIKKKNSGSSAVRAVLNAPQKMQEFSTPSGRDLNQPTNWQ